MNKFDLKVIYYDPDYDCVSSQWFFGLTMRQVFRLLTDFEVISGRDNMRSFIRIA